MIAHPELATAGDPPRLPAGTVTFAFTDIEGSTMRWERDRAAMQEALRRHDSIVRTAVAGQGGHVFKTVGDAFCTVFSRPEEAVGAMLTAQHALAAEDFRAVDGLRIRAAVHTGTTDERDGDYFGPAVNRVARLLAIGHGGQVLISSVTSELVTGALPSDASLRDLGAHRLKDLAQPEHVFQLMAPGLVSDFPPLRSLEVLPNNLPVQRTSFVGCEDEVADITALVQRHQLVTIVGSGGVGKTRTSLQVGANLLDGSPDGVWLIELAPLSKGDYLPTTVAQAMGISLRGDGDPLPLLVDALKSKRALLIFDNCEHVLEAAARSIAALLRGCPEVRILASTRQPLGVSGETAYRLPALRIPESAEGLTAASAARYPAIVLFEERAAAVNHQFLMTDENALAIADICRRLDGIPLAIELAAARVKILSPRQLNQKLDERFRVLTGGSRDVLPRQQTLRALIDWSHDLLDERERALFRRLAVFANGFSMDGAVAAGGGEGLDEFDIFDVLASLVDKSLVLSEPDGDSLRYRMLESTRAYAGEKLDAMGERAGSSARHVRFFRDLFAGAETRWQQSGRSGEMLSLLVEELEDVRVALDVAERGVEIEAGGELLASVVTRWNVIGLENDGISRLGRLSSLVPESALRLRSLLLAAFARLAFNALPARALAAASEAVALARTAHDSEALAGALVAYANCLACDRNFDEAAAALREAESVAPPSNAALHFGILQVRAFLLDFSGDLDAAAGAWDELRKTHLRLGNTAVADIHAQNLAEVEHQRGRTAHAAELVREVLPALRSGSHRGTLLGVLANLCGYLVALDRLEEARDVMLESALVSLGQDRDGTFFIAALEHTALALALANDVLHGAELAGYTEAAFARIGYKREFTEQTTRTRLEQLLRDRMAGFDRETLLARGATLSSESAVSLALSGSDV